MIKYFITIIFSLCIFVSFVMHIQRYAHAKSNKALYPIGEIAAIEGTAYSSRDSGRRPLRQGDPIYFKSLIETGPQSRALILFIDDSEVTIGDDASLMIDEYMFDPYDAEENLGEFTFLKGAFLWTSGMIANNNEPDVTLNTAKGSIGIRGTTVWGGTLDKGYGVFVADGAVNFSGDWGQADIKAGSGVFIGSDLKAGETKPWANETVQTALKTITFRNTNKKALDRRIKAMKKENMQKRHDYRARMFPYKENPFRKRLKIEEDNFFSDEFEEMRGRQ